MSSNDIIRAWKDPEHRDDGSDVEHPSGDIALSESVGGDYVVPTFGPVCTSIIGSLSLYSAATSYLSCNASGCANTWDNGTCSFPGSYGCCNG